MFNTCHNLISQSTKLIIEHGGHTNGNKSRVGTTDQRA